MTLYQSAGLSPATGPWYMGSMGDTMFGLAAVLVAGATVALCVLLLASRRRGQARG